MGTLGLVSSFGRSPGSLEKRRIEYADGNCYMRVGWEPAGAWRQVGGPNVYSSEEVGVDVFSMRQAMGLVSAVLRSDACQEMSSVWGRRANRGAEHGPSVGNAEVGGRVMARFLREWCVCSLAESRSLGGGVGEEKIGKLGD